MKEKEPNSYEKISPTAWLVARQRSFTDIPYAQEFLRELEKIMKETHSADEREKLDKLIDPQFSPVIEARYKLANRLLRKSGVRQVLELASGFSPRGLDLTKDPSMEYVEVDLPGVMKEKHIIIDALMVDSDIQPHANLHLEEGDAFSSDDLMRASAIFKKENVAVINEGFLTYYDLEKKARAAKNIRELLGYFGGIWITPDLSLFPAGARAINAPLKDLTGIDKLKVGFESEDAAREFFESQGFDVESHPFSEVSDELASPRELGFSKEEVIEILGPRTVFVMKPRP